MFINAGNLVSTEGLPPLLLSGSYRVGQDIRGAYQDLIKNTRVTAGLGLAVRFSFLRAEINYCVPLIAAENDLFKRGLQFGIGLQFL